MALSNVEKQRRWRERQQENAKLVTELTELLEEVVSENDRLKRTIRKLRARLN